MFDENDPKTERDGDNVNENETREKEREAKEPKSVSFNRDVHVKRFGKIWHEFEFRTLTLDV